MKKVYLIKRIFCGAIFFALFTAVSFAEVSPYEPSVVKAFADSLYEEGFLSQAEGEYKRFLFSFDNKNDVQPVDSPELQSTLLSLCNIYKVQQNKTGINWLNDSFYAYALPEVKEKISLLRADHIFKERNASAFSDFKTGIANDISLFSPDFSSLIQASDFLLNKDFDSLKFNMPLFAAQSVNFEKLNELCSSYKTKSPGLALFFSMVLPGSGKWYTGSFPAFVSSFVTVGSFIAGMVVTGIQTEWESWQPYVFGTCGLVVYITQLYGSYKSAQRYNDALFRVLCEETENIYGKIY